MTMSIRLLGTILTNVGFWGSGFILLLAHYQVAFLPTAATVPLCFSLMLLGSLGYRLRGEDSVVVRVAGGLFLILGLMIAVYVLSDLSNGRSLKLLVLGIVFVTVGLSFFISTKPVDPLLKTDSSKDP